MFPIIPTNQNPSLEQAVPAIATKVTGRKAGFVGLELLPPETRWLRTVSENRLCSDNQDHVTASGRAVTGLQTRDMLWLICRLLVSIRGSWLGQAFLLGPVTLPLSQ